jgi:hypothetical protein
MKARLLALALLATGLAGSVTPLYAREVAVAAQARSVSAPDPALQIKQLAQLFRNGDMIGLAQAVVPPSRWEEIKLVYELHRLEPTSDADRERFAEKIAKFTAPDAVDQLMLEIEPELEKARPQAPAAMLMAFGAMQMAVASPDSDLTDEQRATLQKALPGIQGWASSTDFLSSDSMRRALTLLTDAARQTGISDIDQLKALPLEGVLDRAGTVLAAAKQAVRVYGLDLDAIAASLQVEVLAIEGDTARVRTTVTVFDAPVWAEHELVLIEGRWYDAHSARHFLIDLDGHDRDHGQGHEAKS